MSNSLDFLTQLDSLDGDIVDKLCEDGFCLLKIQDGDLVKIIEQPEHYVTFGEDGWVVEHSLNCRMGGDMINCPYHKAIEYWVSERMYIPDKDNGKRYCIVKVDDHGFPVLHRKVSD